MSQELSEIFEPNFVRRCRVVVATISDARDVDAGVAMVDDRNHVRRVDRSCRDEGRLHRLES